MHAIILAAGMGKRLGELTQDKTKCMVKVNGVTLIERMLSQLDVLCLARIVIVIGYEGNKLKDYVESLCIQTKIIWVENKIYDKTNNIYSLFLARDYLKQDDTLLLESDLIIEDEAIVKLLNNPYPSLALVAKYESWMDGTVVILDETDNITKFVPIKSFSYGEISSYYKTVNIYKFSRKFSQTHYVPFLEAYCKALGHNEYYEQVLRVIAMLDKPEIKALRLENEKWYEIDDIQDLDIAESIFCSADEKLQRMQMRYGGYWRYPYLLDFCYLVNPYFPNTRLLVEMKSKLDTIIAEYPSGMAVNSLLAGKIFNIKSAYTVVGNGASELIKALMDSLEGGIGVIFPTFEEYSNRKSVNDLVIFTPSNKDFSYTAQDVITYFNEKNINTLLLINPDNPSGNFLPFADLLQLIQWTKEKGMRLIVDESFIDFSNDATGSSLLHNHILETASHLIVVKSISKSYGVPGLRLGVLASGDESLIKKMKTEVAIWNINSIAEYYMQIFGKYESDYREACKKFIIERERLFCEMKNIPFLRVIPSQANYFLCEVLPPKMATKLTSELLQRFDILIKDCSNKAGFENKEYVRIAIRNKKDNDKLINSFKRIG